MAPMASSFQAALRALLVISSVSISSSSAISKRALVIPNSSTLPGSWTSQGCYVDVGRTLTQGGYDDNVAMTDESCIAYCSKAGYIYAGTEYSSQCYCGNYLASGSGPAAATDCNMACTGNATEQCGGPNRLNLFWSGTTGPQTNPGNGSWTFSGCYSEGTTGRALVNGVTTTGGSNAMTVDLCTTACQSAGYLLAGTEYSGECWCGNAILNGGALASGLSGCSMLCNGNYSEYCGGSGYLDVYDYQNSVSLPPWTTTTTSTTSSVASTSSSTSVSGSKPSTTSSTSSSSSSSSSSKVSTSSSTSSSKATTSSSSTSKSSTSSTKSSTSTKPSTSTSSTKSSTSSSTKSSTSSSKSSSSSTKSSTVSSTSSSKTSSTSSAKSSSSSTSIKSSSVTSTSKSSSTSTKSSSTSKVSSTNTSSSKSSTSSSVSSTSASKTSTSSSSSSSASSSTSKSTSSSVSSSASSSGSSVSNTKSSTSSSAPSTTSSISTTQGTISTSSSAAAAPTLGIKQNVGNYVYQGCYTEGTNVRALSGAAFYNYTAMTLEMCASDCSAYTYFGVEYGGECYCGNTLNTGSIYAPTQTDCSFICPGSAYEYCGAGNRLEMYLLNGTVPVPSSTSAGPTSSTSTGTVSISTAPVPTGLPTGWTNDGCWLDGYNGRILQNQLPDNQGNTVQVCVNACANAGYTIAGVEYGVQCFCGNALYNGAASATNQADCSTPCPGNSAESCGAGNRMNLYSLGTPQVYQPPAAQTAGLPANWKYMGCLQDNIASNEDPNEILSTFPYMVWNNNSFGVNTPTNCINQCQLFGYNAAGLEYGSECFCGDVENILVASAPATVSDPNQPQYYTRSAIPQIVPDSQCNALCTGNSSYYCGAPNLMSYYAWNGSTPLINWQIPTGTAAGEYSLLIGGVVVPLMTSQVITGKVTFIEKSAGTGEPNGTGAYELDLSQINNFSAAWRTMEGLQTDVFCSAGLTLPDKAGRQLTVAGWAGNSNFGIRLYWPDGSAGVPGTNEWVEDPNDLKLQVPRWYPSAMIMANGSILIVGGEIGSNDAEQPTLEILPATGVATTTTESGYSNTTVYLDFLDRTAPFNLYPFICVVPSGIFIAYYNEARILDENTFQTLKTLPNMPGAVNDPTGGRNYQLEGSMVILPQYPPYAAASTTVLICGGSTSDGGYAIDNCVSTQPEAASPTWAIERMPSRRVMPCIAGLPDGTYLILNGGQHGVAGFGLGDSPNLNAVLYDPTKAVNSRMSIMANTTVARMYHSEAIVLLDGRVMVSGSDPTGDYVNPPTNEYPEEYRVEVFSPPYLLSGAARPTFTVSSTDWAYGATISFTVTSGAATQVSLLGSVVSTHGNSMGQRTIFPAMSCGGGTCTVTAPPDAHACPPGWYMMFVLNGPTPSVGQFVRIGGDPASLGNWPNLPAFQLPGV